MLYTETVERETFKLLKTLMQDVRLKSFNLAGGTALALHLGHRLSVDLDLFSTESFNAPVLEKYLTDKYHFRGDFLAKDTLKGTINGVKIDCITYDYPFVESPLVTTEGVRLYGMKDIAAMKLSAIADNGTRLKDFVDIACLSTKMPFSEMLKAYQKKYPSSNPMRPVKGLGFFDEINFHEPIQMIGGTHKWSTIEQRIQNMMKHSTKIFNSLPIETEKKKLGLQL